MARQYWKGGALLAPVPPALVTCNNGEKSNVLTVAWTGILSTVPPKTYVSVRPSRFSHQMIKESSEFVINIPTSAMAREVDYCGIFSGANVDKFEKCGFSLIESKHVKAPTIENCPISLECRVCEIIHLGSHDMFLADIVGVSVDDSLLNSVGKLSLERASLLAYAHGDYYALGKRLASFGFSAERKNSAKKKRAGIKRLKEKKNGHKGS